MSKKRKCKKEEEGDRVGSGRGDYKWGRRTNESRNTRRDFGGF